MRHKILLIGMCFVSLTMSAQFTVETHAGDPILDGDIVSFGQVGAELSFYVYNTSSSDINMKIEFVSVQNGDQNEMELCFGQCYTGIEVGKSYPLNGVITIAPGQHQTSSGDHFLNLDSGNGSDVLDYVFKFYQVNDQGFQIGTPLTFTYRYDPNMGIPDKEKMAISVYPTVVEDMMMVDSNEELEMEVYSLLGSLVKSTELSRGKNQISMSDLASQVYLVRFKNENGDMLTKKIIIK